MATLLKFKLLATQCTTAKSPSMSPAAPSSRRHRRRPTLQKLLARSPSRARGGDRAGGDRTASTAEESNKRGLLRDLLLASPPPLDADRATEIEIEREFIRPGPGPGPIAGPVRRGRRLGPVGFRYRMMFRRSWRPVLVTIPE